MKKIILLLFVVSQLFAKGQTIYTSSCVGTDSLKKKLYSDAFSLALKRLYELKSPDTAFVQIPQANIDSILDKLIAIYNLPIEEADTVFNYYNIHVNTYFDIPSIVMYIDTSKIWKTNWSQGITMTGDSSIDMLLEKYSLKLLMFDSIESSKLMVWFKSEKDLNYKSIVDTLKAVNGITSVFLFYPPVPGVTLPRNELAFENNIFIFKVQDDTLYKIHTWSFQVNHNCSVTYLGKDLGLGVKKNLTDNQIKVFPNPFTNEINLSTNNSQTLIYELYDAIGNLIVKEQTNIETTLNVEQLKHGFYTLRIKNGDKYYTMKMIK